MQISYDAHLNSESLRVESSWNVSFVVCGFILFLHQNIINHMHIFCPKKILSGFVQNAELRLELDNTRMAVEDFQIK